MTNHRMTIGLEMHVQLKTESKMFCGCSTEFGKPPNTQVCPVCLGMPGVLPVINRRAFEMAVRTAVALDCTIPEFTKFDRKSYYYPDLPKNYQISQYDQPLSRNGCLEIDTSRGPRRIGITRVHLEEDAGKLLHTDAGASSVDLNRTGTPLMEIVSDPDVHSIEELHEFLGELKLLVTYLDVSNCNMEEGNIRADANISVQIDRDGEEISSPISEIKNMNSFSACEKAMAFEAERLYRRLRDGITNETHPKETRGWNEDRGVTVGQRQKEEASDYRYFPDPDLPPIIVDYEWKKQITADMPELPRARRRRFIEQYKLSAYDARVLTADREVADYFEELVKESEKPRAACVWVSQYVMREMNQRDMTIATFPVKPKMLAEAIWLIDEGVASTSSTQATVFPAMIETGKSAKEIVDEQGLAQVSDTGALEGIVEAVISKYPSQVEEFRAGKQQVLNFLVGMVMKESKGKANPQVVQDILKSKLR